MTRTEAATYIRKISGGLGLIAFVLIVVMFAQIGWQIYHDQKGEPGLLLPAVLIVVGLEFLTWCLAKFLGRVEHKT